MADDSEKSKLTKSTRADGWAVEVQVCHACLVGKHHCSTEGCECPICHE
jgi:hypothetical protein